MIRWVRLYLGRIRHRLLGRHQWQMIGRSASEDIYLCRVCPATWYVPRRKP